MKLAGYEKVDALAITNFCGARTGFIINTYLFRVPAHFLKYYGLGLACSKLTGDEAMKSLWEFFFWGGYDDFGGGTRQGSFSLAGAKVAVAGRSCPIRGPYSSLPFDRLPSSTEN
jgi:hypothetical protein